MDERKDKALLGKVIFFLTLAATLYFFWWLLIFDHGVAPEL